MIQFTTSARRVPVKQKIVLLVSVAVGVIAALLTRAYLSAKDAEVRKQARAFAERHGLMDVLILKRDMPGGAVVEKSDLLVNTVPAAGVRGQALTPDNVIDIVGRKLLRGHSKHDVLFWADFEGGGNSRGGLSDDVGRGWRAISISISGAAAVSGMVRPNDHVDVIGTFPFPAGADANGKEKTNPTTLTILQNVLVLATGKDTAKTAARTGSDESRAGYSTVTLQVLPREAEIIAFAEQLKGRLYLSLRDRREPPQAREIPKIGFDEIPSALQELNDERQRELQRVRR